MALMVGEMMVPGGALKAICPRSYPTEKNVNEDSDPHFSVRDILQYPQWNSSKLCM